MRKIIGALFQSLDGVIQAPGGPEEDQTGFAHGGWVFPYFDDSLHEPMGRLLGGSYELLLGRTGSEPPFGRAATYVGVAETMLHVFAHCRLPEATHMAGVPPGP